jgi:hypothetical protein
MFVLTPSSGEKNKPSVKKVKWEKEEGDEDKISATNEAKILIETPALVTDDGNQTNEGIISESRNFFFLV